MRGVPFDELGNRFVNYVTENPEFLFYADLPSIYPMVTMRQMEFFRKENENNFQVTEKLISESFRMKEPTVQGDREEILSLDIDIFQRVSLQEV